MPRQRDDRPEEREQERREPEDAARRSSRRDEDETIPAQLGEDPGTLDERE